ncbi:hypothetical protein [Piscinibacter sp.]|uniref:hypothetical protein n=1 Tax=Piscinibacter sp. TaxID=1903157 RepID=UPI002B976767|nr:hypothetical protein [Albitalea sp.]HUG25228.1 hypothetical protein [Albitalea sp.]
MPHSFITLLFAGALSAALVVQAAQGVRPDVGLPLQQAGELVHAQRFKEALAKVREADAVGGKTADESHLVERMRIAAASGAGDVETAARSFDAVSARVSAAERLQMIESLAGACYRAGKHLQAMQWGQRYFKEGGSGSAVRMLLIQSQYLTGDFQGAARELTTEIQQTEKSGRAPGEDRLKLLANAALKVNDTPTYVYALERLVRHYPKKEYWIDLLGRLQRKPNFSDRLALDTYRLSLATGGMGPSRTPPENGPVPAAERSTSRQANDYMEMAQLALQSGFPIEARHVLGKGFEAKVLGNGPEAGRHQRLKDLVDRKIEQEKAGRDAAIAQAHDAKDGTALVNAGMNLVFHGDKAQGLQLMQQGMAKGNFKRPEDVKLHHAIALFQAGEAGRALQTFRTVRGGDGTADLARLWALHATGR